MNIKKFFTVLSVLLITSIHSQNPEAWYEFANGGFTNIYGTNNFTKTGSSSTQEIGRDGGTNEAISLNSDILTAATPNASNTSARSMTLSFWIKTTTLSNKKVLINHLNTQSPADFLKNDASSLNTQNTGFMVLATPQGIEAKMLYKDVNGSYLFANTAMNINVIDDNQWHHIAVILAIENDPLSASDASIRRLSLLLSIRVDGNSISDRSDQKILSQTDADAVNPIYEAGDFSIGGLSSFVANDRFQGTIDDLVIYGRNLVGSEINGLNNPKRTLTAIASNGTILVVPESANNKYIHDILLSITPKPDATYGFVNWSGSIIGNNNPVSVTMNADKNITANFSAGTASISDEKKIDFSIYPNPSQEKISISTDLEVKNISIYNLLGEKVQAFKTRSIDISSLNKGIYLLKLETKNGKTGIQKIIKK